uniref:Lanthionine synthetase C family protein n=1 Tax=Solibacter usitatus (strain Ellin6076) TaxID=234267 RepID=Q01SQ5_SOLUE
MSSPSPANSAGALESLVRRLRVFPDLTGFEWFGVPQAITSSPTPGASETRKLLRDAVTTCLYENFYCTGIAMPHRDRSLRERSNRYSRFVQSVLNANSTRVAWSPTKVLRVTESAVVTSLGDVSIYTDRTSRLLNTLDGRPIPPDAASPFPSAVKVGARSWTLSASPGFILMIGRLELTGGQGAFHRVYWNLNPTGAAEFVAAATHNLNRLRIPFRLKLLAEPRHYDLRLDRAIVYVNLRAAKAREALAETYRQISHHLSEGVPAMTCTIAPGLAVAEDPGDGTSFGMHRCRLIAEGFVRSAENALTAPTDVLAQVERVFAHNGINLDRPHHRREIDDAYTVDFARLLDRTPSPKSIQADAAPDVPPEVSWLSIADTIGRQVAADAFWSGDRCQWMGGEMDRSNQVVFRTLSGNLYGGVAGIGHFLAELAYRTQRDELAATALGAMRQALVTAEPDGPGGLYDGTLGTVLTATRAARALGDSKLLEQASAMARRLAARTPERGPDLLNGLAGQIVGFLILADLVPDHGFRCRAIEVGGLLVESAEYADTGCSWSNPLIESTANLTGLSHGTTGIAVALAELWRSTGDRAFFDAAAGAIAYEDAAFSEKHSNWPDYRLSRDGTKHLRYTNFWCHGAPGIILGRLRLSQLMGLREPPPHLAIAMESFRRAVEINAHRRGVNFSLCHGVAGNTEILRETSRFEPAGAAWQQRAAETADACWRAGAGFYTTSRVWPCGDIGDNPSMMLGRSGIGYAYLRLHDGSVPSILAMDPTAWGSNSLLPISRLNRRSR